MKRFLSYLFLLLTPLIASCSDSSSEADDVDSAFTVSPTNATVDKDGGTLQLTIRSSKVPTATSSAAWITTGSRAIIDGGFTLSMNVAPNTEPQDRTATIQITCGSVSQSVQVTQSATDVLTVEPSVVKIDDQEQTVSLTVKTNGTPNVSIDAGWIVQTSASTDTRNFHVEANTGAARTATITFKLGKLTATATVEQAQGVMTVSVDRTTTFQTMEGFAASDCWAPAVIGKYWTGSRAGIAELLFSREVVNGQPKGIGLSMWRSNLGAGSAEQGLASQIGVEDGRDGYNYYRRAESYLNDDLSYDWTRCEGQRYFLDAARDYGVESIVLFSNSPNVQFTSNGKAFSASGHNANLKGDCYDDFAAYMAKVAAQYRAWGYPVTHISPVNEPQYTWDGHDQEGSGWSNAEVAKLTRELNSALDAEGLADVRIVLAEAASWREAYEGSASNANCLYSFFNANSTNYVGNLAHVAPVFGGHSYWTDGTWKGMRDVRKAAADKAASLGVGLWQTEWSMLGDGYSEFPGYDQSNEMDIALVMDKVIFNDLTVGNMSSWSFWTSMDVSRWSQLNRFMLIDFTPSGGTYSVDLSGEGSYKADANLWVLGNYSLFVRPGYKRIAVDSANIDRFFFGTGFISPDARQLVLVMSNLSDAPVLFRAKGLEGARSIQSYTTTLKKHLQQKVLDPAANEFTLEASSVTTLVIEL